MKKMTILAVILLLPAGSCMNGASEAAICDGTAAARTAHAAALAAGGDDASVVTGAALIRLLDAGCSP
jgi:hypothetical protein